MYEDYDYTVDMIATVLEIFPFASEEEVIKYLDQMEHVFQTLKKLL